MTDATEHTHKRNHSMLFFGVWLLFLSTLLRFIQVTACITTSLVFNRWINIPLHETVEVTTPCYFILHRWHLDSFYLLTNVNIAAMNTHEHVFEYNKPVLISLKYLPRSKMVGLMFKRYLYLAYWGTTICHDYHTILLPTSNVLYLFLYIFINTCYFPIRKQTVILVGMKWYLIVV